MGAFSLDHTATWAVAVDRNDRIHILDKARILTEFAGTLHSTSFSPGSKTLAILLANDDTYARRLVVVSSEGDNLLDVTAEEGAYYSSPQAYEDAVFLTKTQDGDRVGIVFHLESGTQTAVMNEIPKRAQLWFAPDGSALVVTEFLTDPRRTVVTTYSMADPLNPAVVWEKLIHGRSFYDLAVANGGKYVAYQYTSSGVFALHVWDRFGDLVLAHKYLDSSEAPGELEFIEDQYLLVGRSRRPLAPPVRRLELYTLEQ